MVTTDQVNSLALKVFLNSNPWLQAALSALSESEADILGIGIEAYREQRLEEALSKEAEDRQLHPWDYKLLIAESNGLDARSLRELQMTRAAEVAGLTL